VYKAKHIISLDALKRNNKMKRSLIIGILLAILAAGGGGGYFWAHSNAKEKAIQQISKVEEKVTVLFKSQLNEDIEFTYDLKSFVLYSQTLNLENLSVKGSLGELLIPKLSISVSEGALNINNLEKLKLKKIGESESLAEISSIKINNLNVNDLIESKNLLDLLSNLKFENLEVLNVIAKHKDTNEPGLEISKLSIKNVNLGNVENVLLKGFFLQDTRKSPKIFLENLSIDKLSELASLFKNIDTGNKINNLGNLFDLGSVEVSGIQVKDPITNQTANVDSFNIKLARDNGLVNSIKVKLTGLEVDKSLLQDQGVLPDEVLLSFKEDKLKLNTALKLNADYNLSEFSSEITIGLDKIGEISLQAILGGFSKDFINYVLNNLDRSTSKDFTNKVNQTSTYKSLKASFSNDGLTEIVIKQAQNKMNLTPDQMVLMVSQNIENSGEILSSDLKEKLKKAITTFIKSGKGLSIAINSKVKEGILFPNLVASFMSGSIEDSVELEIKGE
jgi:hypothetical protein